MGARGDHRAMQVMAVVVMVVVDGQARCGLAEQLDERRVTADLLRVARAAHVAVQAHHLVGGAHYQVQVVGHHQHAAAVTVAKAYLSAIRGLPRMLEKRREIKRHISNAEFSALMKRYRITVSELVLKD